MVSQIQNYCICNFFSNMKINTSLSDMVAFSRLIVDKLRSDIAQKTACALAVVLYVKVIGCPIRWITGIPCAGCGMTRAWIAVLHLNFCDAYYYHPLYPLPLVALILFLMKKKIKPWVYKLSFYIIAVLFLVVYLYRLVHGDDVLVVDIKQGIIFQIISWFQRR